MRPAYSGCPALATAHFIEGEERLQWQEKHHHGRLLCSSVRMARSRAGVCVYVCYCSAGWAKRCYCRVY